MSVVKDKYRKTKEYHLVYSELINAARHRGTVTYQEIAKIIGLPLKGNYMGAEIGQLLGEISEDEFNNDRPMLSAIAVNTKGSPGSGFFELARSLEKLTDESKEGEKSFWADEKKAVYDTWKVILPEE